MPTKAKKLVLLDSHAILHRGYHAMPNFTSSKGEPTGALYGLAAMILSIMKEMQPDYIIAAFDMPEPTFRDKLYKEYKGKRQKLEDDLVYQLNRAHDLVKAMGIPLLESAGFEADDVLGTIVEETKKDKKLEIIVASGDMDTMCLAADKRVKIFTLRKGIKDTVIYDAKAILERYGFPPERISDYKALRGDPSDNIIGVPGIGEKTATELIQKFGSLEDIYKKLKKNRKAFLDAGFKERIVELLETHEEEAEFSLMLATIRTDAPIKFALPDKWGIDVEGSKKIFEELGFRSLIGRLNPNDQIPKPNQALNLKPQVNPETEFKIKLATWILDSNDLNPTGDGDLDKLLAELKQKDLLKIYNEIEMPLVPILRTAEERGILVDASRLKEISKIYTKKLEGLKKEIWAAAGQEFNINSPKQIGELLFAKLDLKDSKMKRTSTGQISTNAKELDKLRGLDPTIDKLLAYRELAKLLSTYIEAIPEQLDKSSRLHTHFVQWGSATGRLASRDPNLQNIPIKTEQGKAIREAFIASEGYELVSLDYSQIDLRSLAVLSKDEKLITFFKQGGDIHADVASELFNVPKEKIDHEMRRRAKVINFGIIYGMGVLALKANLGSSRKEAEEFYNKYFETFAGVAKYLEDVKKEARAKGYTETLFGRRRYYPDINRGPEYMQKAAERAAQNAPVQGTSADVIKIAMIEVDKYLEKENLKKDVHLLLQIHDELIFEVKSSLISKGDNVIENIKKIMEGVVPGAPIPFPVKSSHGKAWSDL